MEDPLHTLEHRHFLHRSGWLRAAVLGANDGIVSTASLIVGVAAASADRKSILIAGIAGLVAGAMSMAAGEYVSVSSQSDTERADIETERKALVAAPEAEREELARIYSARGVKIGLARRVAKQLMQHDALAAHARDELGLSAITKAQPVLAALASAAAFSAGAALPLATAAMAAPQSVAILVSAASLVSLGALGVLSARAGGAPIARAVARVMLWGAFAMGVTAGIGAVVGIVV